MLFDCVDLLWAARFIGLGEADAPNGAMNWVLRTQARDCVSPKSAAEPSLLIGASPAKAPSPAALPTPLAMSSNMEISRDEASLQGD
jgi:hypothetical protein